MPSAFLRLCVFLAGTAVVAAATHANVEHAGGYASSDAPLIIALALLLAIGMGFVGFAWRRGQAAGALALGLLILAGETYWTLSNAEREIARREERHAPLLKAHEDRAEAEKRVQKAEEALKDANDAVTSEAAKRDCLKNCAALLAGAATAARADLDAARRALENTPRPLSPAPLPARLGIAPWLWDLIMAALRSLAVVGGSLAIGMSMHTERGARHGSGAVTTADSAPKHKPPKRSARVEVLAPPSSREHVAQFLRSALKPDPTGQTSLRALHRRYDEWCKGEGLSAAELGRELRAIIDALGLKCEPLGRDVIVYGAAIDERTS